MVVTGKAHEKNADLGIGRTRDGLGRYSGNKNGSTWSDKKGRSLGSQVYGVGAARVAV